MHSTQIPRCRKQGPWMCPNPPPPPSNPGGIFCHYWLLCERGMQECSIRCPEASAGRASKRCVLLAITAHWVTGQWKMSDKHHSENRVPPPLPRPLWQYKWFKNSTRDGAAYFKWHHESQKVKWNIQGWNRPIRRWVDRMTEAHARVCCGFCSNSNATPHVILSRQRLRCHPLLCLEQ